MRAALLSTAVNRLGAAAVRALLSGRSSEQVHASPVLRVAARFPIADEWTAVAVPGLEPVFLPSTAAPMVCWAGLSAFEPEIVPTFLRLAAKARTVVDVGANIGVFSLLARRANPDARIIAIEPNPLTVEVLRRSTERNGAAIEVRWMAAADREEEVLLSLEGGLSSIVADRWAPRVHTVRVPARPLDDLVESPVDLVKIDAEGAELKVLAGMRRILAEDSPQVVCEIAVENLPAVRELCAAFGYSVTGLPSSDREPAAGTVDCLLMPPVPAAAPLQAPFP